MSFSPSWLALREPFDHAARSEALARALPVRPGDLVVELGCGLGSGARWLAPRLPDARWLLVDHDPALLEELPVAMAGFRRPWSAIQADVRELSAIPVGDVVTVQALLDLCSWDWLVAFADLLAARRVPLLAALTVDGRVDWSDPIALDAEVQAAFRLHQLGDRGFGSSPGPTAATLLADLLRVRGFQVELARADWVIGPECRDMLAAMVAGTAHAAAEVHPRPARVADWQDHRLAAIADGRLALRVGHLDLLAVPSSTTGAR